MQKTNFRFEAIVHDDASTDGTADIVREYAEKYPEIIKPVFQTENQYSKRDGSLTRALDAAMSPASKYVAVCEGDDYWTDPYKLQKQVDFLEGHSEHSMCFHKAKVVDGNGKIVGGLYENLEERDYSGDEILQNWIIPTASVVFKREYLNKQPSSDNYLFRDIVLFLTMTEYGKVRCLCQEMSVYRRLATGEVYTKLQNDRKKPELIELQIIHYEQIKSDFDCIDDRTVNRLIIICYLSACKSFFLLRRWKSLLIYFKRCCNEYGLKNLLFQAVKTIGNKFHMR